ncbi:MAG: N-acetyltransferase [Tissierellia bacterium]|nr:N-acetyltransferase [Tissierellia bacterium]
MEIIRDNELLYIGEKENPEAFIKYKIQNGEIAVVSTVVKESLRGQGIAEKLMDKVVEIAKKENLKINPICSYADVYLRKREELLYLRA